MRRATLLCTAFVLLVTAACSGGGNKSKEAVTAPPQLPVPASTVTEPSTSTTLPYPVFTSATAQGSTVSVYDDPNQSTPVRVFQSPNPLYGGSTYRVFLVKETKGDWLNVYLPIRPNGATGWIKKSEISTDSFTVHIVVELSEHRLTLYDKNEVKLQEPVGVGRSATPSTTGLFYTTELLIPDGQPQYGAYAFVLSAYSEVLFDFAGGDGQMGIHGTNDPSSVGHDVSNGCIRMTNDAVTRLKNLIPAAGVPVEIKP